MKRQPLFKSCLSYLIYLVRQLPWFDYICSELPIRVASESKKNNPYVNFRTRNLGIKGIDREMGPASVGDLDIDNSGGHCIDYEIDVYEAIMVLTRSRVS